MERARTCFTLTESQFSFMFLVHVALTIHIARGLRSFLYSCRIYSLPYHQSDWRTTSFAASDGIRNLSLNTLKEIGDDM